VDFGSGHVGPLRSNTPDSAVEIDSAQVLAESTALDDYFQHGFRHADEAAESEDSEDEQEVVADDEEGSQLVDTNPRTGPALAWADKFILETRRKGGRQTESSVLKLWMVC